MAKRQTTCVDYHKDGEPSGPRVRWWMTLSQVSGSGSARTVPSWWSGYFKDGKQVGEWTTYDAKGKVYKVTKMKAPI